MLAAPVRYEFISKKKRWRKETANSKKILASCVLRSQPRHGAPQNNTRDNETNQANSGTRQRRRRATAAAKPCPDKNESQRSPQQGGQAEGSSAHHSTHYPLSPSSHRPGDLDVPLLPELEAQLRDLGGDHVLHLLLLGKRPARQYMRVNACNLRNSLCCLAQF